MWFICNGAMVQGVVQGVIRWVSTMMSWRKFIKRDSVGVKEKEILFIDNISGSSQLGSNFIYFTRFLLLIELRLLREGFLRLDVLCQDRR